MAEVNGEYHEGGFETGELQSRNGETSLSIPAHEPGSRILPMNRDTRDSSQDTIKRSLPHRPATTASFPAKLDNDSDSEGIETPGGSGGGSMCKQGQVKRNSNATARASLGASSTTEMENAESDEVVFNVVLVNVEVSLLYLFVFVCFVCRRLD